MSSQNDSVNDLEDLSSSKPETDFFQTWGAARLRLLFLLPMVLAFLIVLVVLGTLLYQHAETMVKNDTVRVSGSAQQFYEEGVRYDVGALQGLMHVLEHDETLHKLLAAGDRKALLRHSESLFNHLKQDYSITHLYFTGTDRINILRVHTPTRYGDEIKRITMMQAENTGTTAVGMELGPLGTLTLRLVSPWYDDSHGLIGYVEIGMELDQVLDKIRDFLGLEVLVLLKKEFLNQAQWESGMRMLGKTPQWDHFSRVVTNEPLRNELPMLVVDPLTSGKMTVNDRAVALIYRGFSYRVVAIPLLDAAERHVADMVLISNVSQVESSARTAALWVIGATIIVGALLVLFFYWLVGRIGRHIEKDHKRLEELATHDGLTKLFNHRMFYYFLEGEIERVSRYHRPVSLLMVDIDLFKGVNDTYGHRAGDTVLHDLSQLLVTQLRAMDRVCRYGGEEITIILPESDTEVAVDTAERLRKLIEGYQFDIGEKMALSITVSIGVTTSAAHRQVTASELVSQADAALYLAKESGRNRVCTYAELEHDSH